MKVRSVLIPIAVLILACAGVDTTPTSTPTQPSSSSPSSQLPTSSVNAIQIASQVGLPQVVPGSNVAGPFDGPEGSIFYVNTDQLITVFLPETHMALMGRMDTGEFIYGMSLDSFYAVNNGQLVDIGDPPNNLGMWPFSENMARVMISLLQDQYIQRQHQQRQASGGDGVPWETMSEISAGWHDVNMQIARNIGGEGCIPQYEGPYYVGCY